MTHKKALQPKNDIEYRWRKGMPVPAQYAQVFGEAIDKIEAEMGHAPTSEDVVERAQSPRSEIHNMFNWNDEEAAHKYRKLQASAMLGNLTSRVVVEVNNKILDMWLPVRTVTKQWHGSGEKTDHGQYEHMRDVLANPEKRRKMLQRIAHQMLNLEARARYFREFAPVFDTVRSIAKTHRLELKRPE